MEQQPDRPLLEGVPREYFQSGPLVGLMRSKHWGKEQDVLLLKGVLK